MSKFDLVENENNKLISEILCKLDEENNQAKKENESTSINNNENQANDKENEDNSVSQALDSIKDVLYLDFDDFWNYTVFKKELENPNSKYIIAIINNQIVFFVFQFKLLYGFSFLKLIKDFIT